MSSPADPAPEGDSYDVVVVGSGAAGMTAALAAALRGLSVVLIEGASSFGGTTAYSGGAVWIPGSGRAASQSSDGDTFADADAYLTALTGDHVSAARRQAFLHAAPAMIEELETRTRWIAWDPVKIPDYRPEEVGGRTGGRALECRIVDGRLLGDDLARVRPASPATDVKGLPITSNDYVGLAMIARTRSGWTSAARILARLVTARIRGRRPLSLGQALVARLRLALRDAGVPVVLCCPMTGLVTENGRVTGVRAERGGASVELAARLGVVMAAGGFSQNPVMRDKYLPAPTDATWSLAPADGQNGDAITAGLDAGAALDLMDRAWGMPTALVSKAGRDDVPMMLLSERGLPGTIVIDAGGERFANEALPYAQFWDAMYADPGGGAKVPSWLVLDQRAKNRYSFLAVPPRLPFPRGWYAKGHLHKAPTPEALAHAIGVPASSLATTVAEFNGAVQAGEPDRFGRGESAYDRFYGDPTLTRPNIAPLDKAPYYAIPLFPGDLGTQGGLAVDEHSRVLRPDGSVLEGLYAAGNCCSGVMGRTYPGPGATISAAMVAGYLAARHLAGA